VFAAPAQGSDHFVERQDAVGVWLAAQPAGEPGQHLPPPGPAEVVFHIHP
jgi:hypothetical protein